MLKKLVLLPTYLLLEETCGCGFCHTSFLIFLTIYTSRANTASRLANSRPYQNTDCSIFHYDICLFVACSYAYGQPPCVSVSTSLRMLVGMVVGCQCIWCCCCSCHLLCTSERLSSAENTTHLQLRYVYGLAMPLAASRTLLANLPACQRQPT